MVMNLLNLNNTKSMIMSSDIEPKLPPVDHLKEMLKNTEPKKETRKGIFKIGRNEKCYCGSGKKFKHCCYDKHNKI